MKKLLLIILVFNFSLCGAQTIHADQNNDSILYIEYLNINKKLDSIQNLMDSISNSSDSIYQIMLNEKLDRDTSDFYKKRLLGIWTSFGTPPNKEFNFTQDSVFYFDHQTSYNYIIKSNEIVIFKEKTNDTLTMNAISKDFYILENKNENKNYRKLKYK